MVCRCLKSKERNPSKDNEYYSKTSDKISEYTIGLIPGEGYTEASIDLRESSKPDYSILAVRELLKIDSGNIFTSSRLKDGSCP